MSLSSAGPGHCARRWYGGRPRRYGWWYVAGLTGWVSMVFRVLPSAAIIASLSLWACGGESVAGSDGSTPGPDSSVDDGGAPDAGAGTDGGTLDGALAGDSGIRRDSGAIDSDGGAVTSDGGAPEDAATTVVDGGTVAVDGGGGRSDGGAATDGGLVGADAGRFPDGGLGADGGAPVGGSTFRFDDFDLLDPHVFISLPGSGCTDITDSAPGFASINEQLEAAIRNDGNGDGLLDQSQALTFLPLDTTSPTSPLQFIQPECTSPLVSTSCSPMTSFVPIDLVATNRSSGTCFSPVPGTTRPYGAGVPSVPRSSVSTMCFGTNRVLLPFTAPFGTTVLSFRGLGRIAAEYAGASPTQLRDGVVEIFFTELEAERIMVAVPGLGTLPLASLFPGGSGNCATHDDRDRDPSGTLGWYIYAGFTSATAVPFSG